MAKALRVDIRSHPLFDGGRFLVRAIRERSGKPEGNYRERPPRAPRKVLKTGYLSLCLCLCLCTWKSWTVKNSKIVIDTLGCIWCDSGVKNDYTKLFHRILHSSIWDEDYPTRIVWITLLALRDADGVIESTIKALSRSARVPPEDCQSAIDKFLAPDPESLTSEHEGRRLKTVPGGWLLLNHQKYVQLMGREHQRAYWREKKAQQREREIEQAREKAEETEHKKRLKVATEEGKKEGATRAIKEGLERVNLQGRA